MNCLPVRPCGNGRQCSLSQAKGLSTRSLSTQDEKLTVLQKRVDDLSKGAYGHKWKGCAVFKDYHSMLDAASPDQRPDAMIIGVPPLLHGALVLLQSLLLVQQYVQLATQVAATFEIFKLRLFLQDRWMSFHMQWSLILQRLACTCS